MGASVGDLDLDLNINRRGFDQQLRGIMGIAKKAGAALAGAFAVKKLIDFGAQCVELGSDLAEVQNVVDVTFPQMSKQVDDFARNAAASFGLSETMAKNFAGTFGAMAKAFGFNEKAAYEMSTALTGLSGDVASFYNISQDEAYMKLKSVFTGETESLKDLGIVMTQAALDQYALANGYGKTTQAMSEAEKVALRYKFVTDQLSLASGDFIRTSDGWANQVRVLKLQFDSLKATIGQGLINVLTPVIKVINTIIGKLMSLANAFKAFTELITGKKAAGGTTVAAAGMEEVAKSADNASEAVGGVGDSAGKTGKKVKEGLSGIDKLNVINGSSGSGSSGGGGAGGGGYAADEFDMGELDTSVVEEMDSKYQGLISRVKELASLFKGGFNIAFGDKAVFDSIRESIQGIKDSLKDIFTDPGVKEAAHTFANRLAMDFGKIAGGMASVGASIADNLYAGINQYLSQSKERIKKYLISMFDIGADISNTVGRWFEAIGIVFEAFRSDGAKQITADIIGIFADGFMGVTELIGRFAADVLDLITAPFIQNKDLIKQTLEDTFSAVEPIFSEIKSIVDEAFTGMKEVYDAHIAPMLEAFKIGFTEIATTLLNAYSQHILPVIQEMSTKFREFRDQYISPLIDKFLEFAAEASDAVKTVWKNALKPFIEWFINNVSPIIADHLQKAIDKFFEFWAAVSEVQQSVLEALKGLSEFIIGVFTGDWEKAWSGIQNFHENSWNAIQTTALTAIGLVYDGISEKLNFIKSKWEEIWNGVKSFTVSIFNSIWDSVRGAINDIIGGVEKMANGVVGAINKIGETINGFQIDVPDVIADKVGFDKIGFDIPRIDDIHIPPLAQGGFVKANTPQLAMIGDNRHYGEVVAPENKLQELLDKAVQNRGNDVVTAEMILLLRDMKLLLKIISEKNPQTGPTTREIFEAARKENREYKKIHYGQSAFM